MTPERTLEPLIPLRRGVEFGPQPGPQTDFLATPADITFFGGAAYVGKTWAEVYFPLRYVTAPGYTATIYRQVQTDITIPGGLWAEAEGLYPYFGGQGNRHDWVWKFPTGGQDSQIKMAHATDDERVKGSQVTTALFDEVTQFDEDFFWAVLTRNRSTAPGVPAQMLGTCNPDADSWLAEFLAWWIEQDPSSPWYGLPIPARAGRIRYLVRYEGKPHWFNRFPTAEQLRAIGPRVRPSFVKSVRFIPGRLDDNKIGLKRNPGYEGNLASADPVTVARLLGGNWKVRRARGMVFKSAWFEGDEAPGPIRRLCRGWDLAATANGGDWTAGVLLGQDVHGIWWVLDVVRVRRDAGGVEQLVRATAEADGQDVTQAFAWERAGAGKAQVYNFTRLLEGWNVVGETESGDPAVRAAAFSAQASQRRVRLHEGRAARGWRREYVSELEAFPEGKHDDQLAATLAAFRYLTGGLGGVAMTGEALGAAFAQLHEEVYGPARAGAGEERDDEDEGDVFDMGGTSGMTGW